MIQKGCFAQHFFPNQITEGVKLTFDKIWRRFFHLCPLICVNRLTGQKVAKILVEGFKLLFCESSVGHILKKTLRDRHQGGFQINLSVVLFSFSNYFKRKVYHYIAVEANFRIVFTSAFD